MEAGKEEVEAVTRTKSERSEDFLAKDLLPLAEEELEPPADQVALGRLILEAEEMVREERFNEETRRELALRARDYCNGNEISFISMLEELEELDPELPPLRDEDGDPLPA